MVMRKMLLVWLLGMLGCCGLRQSLAAPAAAWHDVHYHLDVRYDVESHTIYGDMTITALWQGNMPLSTVPLFLPPNTLQRRDRREPAAFHDQRYPRGFAAASLRLQHITDGSGRALPSTLQDDPEVPVGRVPDQGIAMITLPQPLSPGQQLILQLRFITRIPRARNWGHVDGIVALAGLWYPALIPYRGERWVTGLQEFVPAYYQVRLQTAADYTVVASVPWTQRTLQQQQQTLAGSAGPLQQLGLSLSKDWHVLTDEMHAPPLRVAVTRADAALAPHLLETVRSVVVFLHTTYDLTLPAAFTVVVHERDTSWPFSADAPGMLLVSRDLLRVPGLIRKLLEYHIARGVGQQWFGIQTASNLNTERWIHEGLTTYLALAWLDATYGVGRNFLTWKGSWLPNFSYREQSVEVDYRQLVVQGWEQPMTAPLTTTPSHEELRYIYQKKSALVYGMLHDLIGSAPFRTFVQRLAMAGPLVASADVQRLAEEVSGQELAWFFQQWVFRRAQLDYAVGKVRATAQVRGEARYVNTVEVRRLGEAIMPLTVRLLASDGSQYETTIAGAERVETVTWESTAPVSDVQLDPQQRLPDVQRLNNTSHIAYTVRPLIDFPRLDRYLIYPFTILENNFIDGYTPRLLVTALYLNDQSATIGIGYKENVNEISVEGSIVRNRFPIPQMATTLAFRDRLSAKTLLLETTYVLTESHRQQRLPANFFTLGYQVTFLDSLEEFNGETVPANFAPDDGRLHSVVLRYHRDTRVPLAFGAPPEVFAEPLAYGYALDVEAELASEVLGSNRPDYQQVRWDVSAYPRIAPNTLLQLRVFGGWSGGTIPLQRKLSLAGLDAVRGYDYSLRFLGDRLLGGSATLRMPVLRNLRLDDPWRFFGLRGVHLGPFVDAGWVWDNDARLSATDPRISAGLRTIAEIGFGSLLRFEVVLDVAHPIDARGLREESGWIAWIRLQSTARGGIH